jgi:UDP-GlcNAc:undecaprenyl-phosphate GlcNAc-1-phosphate transferase
VFGHYIKFGILAAPLTVLWIVGVTIAVNLIDGLDGLSCGISTISAVSLMLVTILLGEFQIALLIAIIAAACIGFLPFNREPAKIFVGETGATFLGFSLAVVSIQGLFKTQAVITYIIPFLILGVPIFDTAFAMLRRILSGRHPFSADKGHLHHRLVDMGFNKKQTVRTLYAVSALLGVSSIMLVTQKIVYAIIIIAVSLAISVATWIIFKDEKMKIESGLMPSNNNDVNTGDNSNNIITINKTQDIENPENQEQQDKINKTDEIDISENSDGIKNKTKKLRSKN